MTNVTEKRGPARIAAQIARLQGLPLTTLRQEWHRSHPKVKLPLRLSRDLLVRTIVWKAQERAFGRFPRSLERTLDRLVSQLANSGSLALERKASVKVGTRLFREWRGATYGVTALKTGFVYDGREFGSLSSIAMEITGTRWSGPRFFGLAQRSQTQCSYSDAMPDA